MTADDISELEIMLNRFQRLLGDVIKGISRRNSFMPWELEILMDMETCELGRRRLEILRQYGRAVEKQMQIGPGPPMKLSEFLRMRADRSTMMKQRSQGVLR
jgi:hypothetical protein